MSGSIEYHSVANIFPLMNNDEFKELKEDILKNKLIEPIWIYEDKIIDGRNRYKACIETGTEPKFREWDGNGSLISFIISLNLKRRHLNESQRAMIAAKIANIEHGGDRRSSNQRANLPLDKISQSQASKMLNISERTLKSGVKVKENAVPELVSAVESGKIAVSQAARLSTESIDIQQGVVEKVNSGKKSTNAIKEVRRDKKIHNTSIAQEAITSEARNELESVCDLRVCSCRDLFNSNIKPDAVITDPPYSHEFLPLFSELAEGCKQIGVPLVAVMSGQSYLPEVINRLSKHLIYRWTLAYLTPGGQSVQQWQAKVNTSWKPILLFGEAIEWFGDVATSKPNDNDKRFHHWGQSESGIADLVNRLTQPNQLICDPFLGGGTTATVSLALGRRFIGCDINPICIEKTRQRIEIALCKK